MNQNHWIDLLEKRNAEIEHLKAWRKRAITAANAILAPMTMEYGRLMEEAPSWEITVSWSEDHSVKIPAKAFMELYHATDPED